MKDLFVKLVEISSPSSLEQDMRSFLSNYVKGYKLQTKIDKYGNLISCLKGNGQKVVLVAHMDTVQKPGDDIKVVFNGGVFASSGETILGADNKAGITILLSVLAEMAKTKARPTVYFIFTANEEYGDMTSGHINWKNIKPKLVLNVDGCKKPGVVDISAMGQKVFEITVKGKAAHAALNPELGRNAIFALAKTISSLNLGKDKNGDTLNIGSILGGTKTNVVPDLAKAIGEMRSFSKYRMQQNWSALLTQAKIIAKQTKTKIVVTEQVGMGVPIWESNMPPNLKKMFSNSAKTAHLNFVTSNMQACSDANYLALSNVPTFSINRGGKNPHAHTESITLRELEQTKSFIIEILKNIYSYEG